MSNIQEETQKYGRVVRLPKKLDTDLESLQKKFGYKNISDAANNASKVGLKLFKKNPTEFLKLISDN